MLNIANEGCNSFASVAGLVLSFIVCFIARFILLVIGTFTSAYTSPPQQG